MRISASWRELFEFPKHQRISGLVHEALERIPYLASDYNADLKLEFNKVSSLLDAEPVARSQKSLLVGLARQHVARAEKGVVRQILDNDLVSVAEMSHLVRVRLICAEMSNLLTQGLDELRAQNGWSNR